MPSKATVFGNLSDLTGGALAQGTITFELSNIGTGNAIVVSGTTIFPQLKYVVFTAEDGSFTVKIWGNDNISPANTIYNVTYRNYQGDEIGPIQYSITGSSVNLNSAAPINNLLPPVFAAAVSVLTLLNQQGPLSPVTGTGSDATIYTYSLAANAVMAGQGLRITAFWNHSTGSASVTYKLKLGSTTLLSFSSADTSAGSSTVMEIFNNTSVQNAQHWSARTILGGAPDTSSNATGTSSVDLSLISALTLTMNVAATDQVTPELWLVEIINGPANTPGSFPRLVANGTALVSGDFVLTGWGTGATITAIAGCDMAHTFTITSGTAPISINPTVQLTFHDGAWPNTPVILAQLVGGSGQGLPNSIAAGTTSYTLTFGGFPTAAKTYIYNVLMMGI